MLRFESKIDVLHLEFYQWSNIFHFFFGAPLVEAQPQRYASVPSCVPKSDANPVRSRVDVCKCLETKKSSAPKKLEKNESVHLSFSPKKRHTLWNYEATPKLMQQPWMHQLPCCRGPHIHLGMRRDDLPFSGNIYPISWNLGWDMRLIS